MRPSTIVICILISALIAMVVVPVYADDIPTVNVGSFKVNPSVLMPAASALSRSPSIIPLKVLLSPKSPGSSSHRPTPKSEPMISVSM